MVSRTVLMGNPSSMQLFLMVFKVYLISVALAPCMNYCCECFKWAISFSFINSAAAKSLILGSTPTKGITN